ncbi:MAG: acyl-CoA thioesterase domain-containing protein, partial [Actinomycetota bacterium]
MGDLAVDTTVEAVDQGDEGRYRAEVSADWEIWGPMGGYLAGIGLRAAGAHSGRARPASVSGHFLGGVGTGPVDVRTETVRATRVATSTMVTIEQDGRVGFRALVWGVDEIDGLEHQTARRPVPVPDPEALLSLDEVATRVARTVSVRTSTGPVP